MANDIEYAIMAGRVYEFTRSTINWLPDLQSFGWMEFYPRSDAIGFEAISFVKGNEIVISYAGTDEAKDWGTNIPLGLPQLYQAADYYLQVKKDNPGKTISLTGHSLGGGLASLIAVLFNETAITFDQAPFRGAANNTVALELYLFLSQTHSSAELQGLTDFIASIPGYIPNESNVRDISVQGEILSSASFLRIGASTSLQHGTSDLMLTIDLHSQALLIAFLQSDQSPDPAHSFRNVTFKLPDVIRMIFNSELYKNDTGLSGNRENFIERLVRHQNGIAGNSNTGESPITADAMLTRFTKDLWKLAKDGGLTMTDSDGIATTNNGNVSKALIAFAMQMYYENAAATSATKELFTTTGITNGIKFSTADVTANITSAKGYTYIQQYINAPGTHFSVQERALITSMLPTMKDWYVQAGTTGMVATSTANAAFMLGGATQDNLTGGNQNDLLIGNAGNDTLNGGGGDDSLIGGWGADRLDGGTGNDKLYAGTGSDELFGGAGNDTYTFSYGDGSDTINDSDGSGKVLLNQQQLTGSTRYLGGYKWINQGVLYQTNGNPDEGEVTLTIRLMGMVSGANEITVQGFNNNELGIYLAPKDPAPDNNGADGLSSPIILDLDGDGVETIAKNTGIFFDLNSNGFSESTGWASGDDGLLVRDLNANGQIDNGKELFGSETVLSNGEKATNGFEALKELDTYLDGKVDATDSGWASLKIWKDVNQDGVSQSNELLTMAQANIKSINTSYINSNLVDGQGNEHRQNSTYVTTSNITRAAEDVWFAKDSRNTLLKDWLAIPDDVAVLPNLQGYGNVYDLHQAIVRDSTGELKTYVTQFLNAGNETARKTVFENLLLKWTGSDIYLPDSRSYSRFGYNSDLNSNHIYAVEALLGYPFLQYNGTVNSTPNPGPEAANALENTYAAFYNLLYSQLASQTVLKSFFDVIEYSWDTAKKSQFVDLHQTAGLFSALISQDRIKGLDTLDDFLKSLRGLSQISNSNIYDLRETLSVLGQDVIQVFDNALSGALGTVSGDILRGTDFNDLLNGFEGNDSVFGNSGNDIISGGKGNDVLDGGLGNDTYNFSSGDGQDNVLDDNVNSANADIIHFNSGILPAQITVTRDAHSLYLSYGSGTDRLKITNWFDGLRYQIERVEFADSTTFWDASTLESKLVLRTATTFDDVLYGTAGNDSFSGLSGADIISGLGGNDTITGGAGNDILDGGLGNDVYVFNIGDGQDTITDYDATANNQDYIKLASNITTADIKLTSDLNNLYLSVNGTGDKITVQNWRLNDSNKIENIQFTNGSGTLWNLSTILTKLATPTADDDFLIGTNTNNSIIGLGGNDTLYGLDGVDTLDGGGGDDILIGGSGVDVYLFGKGNGNDLVKDGFGGDTVKFATGILPTEVRVSRDSVSLFLNIDSTNEKLTIENFFTDTSNQISRVEFTDSPIAWSLNDLNAKLSTTSQYDDYVFGLSTNESIYGLGGNDEIYGNDGNDTLDGGLGNDILNGGSGNDTYVFGYGYGQDIIYESLSSLGNVDVIQMTSDVSHSQVNIMQVGIDLVLTLQGSSDRLIVQGWFGQNDQKIEQVRFTDNTFLTVFDMQQMALEGTDFSESIEGYTTPDKINGKNGDDTLYGLDGADTLIGGNGNDQIFAGADSDSLEGGENNDDLYAESGNDYLSGGSGNDKLYGGDGADTYFFNRGFGQDVIYNQDADVSGTNIDTIEFAADIAPTDIRITQKYFYEPYYSYPDHVTPIKSLVLTLIGTSDQIEVRDYFSLDGVTSNAVEKIKFADGTIWDIETVKAKALIPSIGTNFDWGYQGNSEVWGYQTNDQIIGLVGIDRIFGDAGDDVITGGADNDVLSGGDGNDSIDGETGSDDVRGGNGNDTLKGGVGADTLYGNDGNDLLEGGDDNDILDGQEGDDTVKGGNGNDQIAGFNGNDELDGGLGNDFMAGGLGSDTYIFERGSGQDSISDGNYTNNGFDIKVDTIYLKGLLSSDVTLSQPYQSNSLKININGTNDSLLVDLQFYGTGGEKYGVDQIKFEDGTIWNTNKIRDVVLGITDNADTINGFSGDDVISALNGNDVVYGLDGNDTLNGDAGNDTLSGGNGNDILKGGIGNDIMYGDAGSDTYVFNLGSGEDTVSNSNPSSIPHNDIVKLDGLNPTDVTFKRDWFDLVISINGTTDKLKVANYFYETLSGSQYQNNNAVDTIQFANGSTLNYSQVKAMFVNQTGTEANDVILGFESLNDVITGLGGDDNLSGLNGNDTLFGGNGNDTLSGGYGNDVLDGGAGNDSLSDYSGASTYQFGRGYGEDVIYNQFDNATNVDTLKLGANIVATDLNLTRKNDDLKIRIIGTTDQITVANYFISGNQVDFITFADSSSWDVVTVTSKLSAFSDGDDIVNGTSGDDTLNGGLGADTLIGGLGNDTYIVDNAGDVVTEVANAGIDTVQSTVSYILGTNLENLTLTGTGAIDATGNTVANVLVGNSAANTLNGGSGADNMTGGAGNDTYIVDNAGDVVIEAANSGTDSVQSSVTHTLSTDVENLTLTGTSAINATGNILNNSLIGNSGNNILDGAAGADAMSGGTGNDTYNVDNAGDTVTETSTTATEIDQVNASVSFTLGANLEKLTLTGTAAINATGNTLNNTLTGNTANNRLDGGVGIDTMVGGTGNDTYVVDNTADVVTETSTVATEIDSIESNVTYTLGNNIENLTLTGTSAINATGNGLANTLVGNSAANTLNGGGGIDTMTGGLGNDIYVVDNIADVTTETSTLATEIDLVQSSVSYSLATNLENLTLTGTAAINATGNSLNNALVGNTVNNVLDGGIGADTMTGGTGNDTYVVDNALDSVVETSTVATEIDLVNASISYTLGSNLEKLTLTGTAAINATGNTLANTLTGNSGNNTLNGAAGADTMAGGLGDDTYIVDNTLDVITEAASAGTDSVQSSVTYSLAGNVENLTLTGTSAINATGNTLANVLTGNSAANTLDGGTGADTMIGGAGNDIYKVDNTGDIVTEISAQGTDTVESSITYSIDLLANLENITLTGTGNINATGNAAANTVLGNAGNNILNGGAGNDVLKGGAGNDTYVVDATGDAITENASEGTDTVQSSITYSIATQANLENITLTGTANINATGNAVINTLLGNTGANILDGGAGADILKGDAGDDTYLIDDIGDVVTENASAGTDQINVSIATANGSYTLAANVEKALLTNTVAFTLTGNGSDNVITGNSAVNTLNGGGGNDTLDGGANADILAGGAGNDVYLIDNAADAANENASEGTDTVRSTLTWTLGANLENLALLGTAAINGTGNALSNFLTGNSAINTLSDTVGGNDIYQGLAGADILNDTLGNNLLDGGLDNDTITAGTGKDLLIGGKGNDTITTGTGFDVISFNKGDGQDTVNATNDTSLNTLSLGGSFAYSDLSLTKTGNNLILKVGTTDQITLKDWYAAAANKSIANLQIIAEAVTNFNLGSADQLRNNKIENFNFTNLVAAFDTAGAPANWALTDAILTTHLTSGSDTTAIGGDLAYQYGRNSNLTGVGLVASQNVINASTFGQSAQTLNNPTTWQAEAIKLG